MNETLRTAYQILDALERGGSCERFDDLLISSDALGVTRTRRDFVLEELTRLGYVSGVYRVYDDAGSVLVTDSPRITLSGAEYLERISLMRRAARGIRDVVG